MRVLRALADVMLVGAGTVRAEGYGGVRVADRMSCGGVARARSHPPLAVVSSRLDLGPGHPFFAARPAARSS